MTTDPYPEHTKLQAIAPLSQAIGEFLDTSGYVLSEHIPWCDWHGQELNECEESTCHHRRTTRLFPTTKPINTILAEFFEIDLDTLEQEKRVMLDALRSA